MIKLTQKNKYILIVIGIISILSIAASISISKINKLNSKIDTLSINNATLIKGQESMFAKNGELLTQVQGLLVSKKELSDLNYELSKKLKALGINYNDVSSTAQLLIKENKSLKLALKDSVRIRIVNDTVYKDSMKCFNYYSKYDSIQGCIVKDSVELVKKTQVPITIILENVYKHKFLWWKWGVLTQKLNVISDNKDVYFTNVKLYIPK